MRLIASVVAVGAAALVATSVLGGAPAEASEGMSIQILSNRADLISGGDALTRIVLPAATAAASVKVKLNGRDITGSFAQRGTAGFVGLVTGLNNGSNLLSASGPSGGARISIINHPIGGPVFAGPQVQPWICSTAAAGLGQPSDAQCDAAPRYELLYKSSVTMRFSAYDPANPPADVATTTTNQNKTVPYIVRRETGAIDRGIYQILALWDPHASWDAWAPQPQWNGKLSYFFVGDCKPAHGGGQPEDMLDPAGVDQNIAGANEYTLSQGYAIATSSLNILGQDCNDVVAAESMMMVKEHFIEEYGMPRYTISNGCSGGSMQQQWIVANYPGLLDGIQPCASFPDVWETMQEAEDCHLLHNYFNTTSPALWAVAAQRTAVEGYAAEGTCLEWDEPGSGYSQMWADPSNAAGCGLPADQVYDQQSNPHGVRCTLQDYAVAVWGKRAQDGFANRPYDNTGLQYGLNALQSGEILPEQFIDLNEKIGGLDIDWHAQAARSQADPEALRVAYRSGRVDDPRASASVPIIDLRGSSVDVHTDVHSYVMRARLDQANGNHANQIIWTSPGLIPDQAGQRQALALLDRWVSAVKADGSTAPLSVKVAQNKPADAVDACWIAGRQVTDTALCRAAFPYFATPRIAAGGPLQDNVLKCQLKPLNASDYNVSFTAGQWTRLQAAFPDGVCDYTKAAVGQQTSIPWMTFSGGPGGQPLGAAPVSTPTT
jgi:hypothetical protein